MSILFSGMGIHIWAKHINIIQKLDDHDVNYPTPNGNAKSNHSFIPSTHPITTNSTQMFQEMDTPSCIMRHQQEEILEEQQ